MKQRRAYGTWSSPISPRSLAGSSGRLMDAQWDSDGKSLVWLEGRGGHSVLVVQRDGDAPRDLTEGDQSIRGRLHYGGGEFHVRNGTVVFVGNGGRLYRVSLEGGQPVPITPAFGVASAPQISPDGRWVVYAHQVDDVDGLAIVDIEGSQWPLKAAYGTDFVMQPVWHSDGSSIAYIAWNHPQMPWDGTELRLAKITYDHAGAPYVEAVETLAGGVDTAVFQPEFSPDGKTLAYVSDQSGWWQLYRLDLASGKHTQLTTSEAEHAVPAWLQGIRMYGWSGDSQTLYSLRNQEGVFTLWRYGLNGTAAQIDSNPYTTLIQISVNGVSGQLSLIGSTTTTPDQLVIVNPEESSRTVRRYTGSLVLKPSQLATGQIVSWTGMDGEASHGIYYAPTSERFEGIGAPPLIVHVHGGPTSQARATYNAEMQFYATRGFAVLQVNHRGGTGYGKAYKDKHRGAWGVYDVEDAASGASYLAEQGLADPDKFVILGGSAGGYTVLQSLVSKPGFYKAGVCLYGISNQFTLVSESGFKFESRYSDTLLGALPGAAPLYRERSPLFHAEQIVDPVIVFQGEDDNVVPQSQSDSIVAALRSSGVPHEYHVYAGEGHGFRKPETIEAYLTATLKFLERYVIYA